MMQERIDSKDLQELHELIHRIEDIKNNPGYVSIGRKSSLFLESGENPNITTVRYSNTQTFIIWAEDLKLFLSTCSIKDSAQVKEVTNLIKSFRGIGEETKIEQLKSRLIALEKNYLRIENSEKKDKMSRDDLKCRCLTEPEAMEAASQGIKNNGLINHEQKLRQSANPTVFLSYNWGSEEIADVVEKRLKPIAEVLRDKSQIGPWGSISQFMKQIRTTDLVVVIVSDAYLKSVACLYEIMQLLKDDNWISHSMFIVEGSAKGIYNPVGQLDYVKYWVNERDMLKKALDGIDPALVTPQVEELKKINLIQLNINDFMKNVADRNNPDLVQAIDAIEKRVKSNSQESETNTNI